MLKIQSMKVDIPMPTPQHEEVLNLMLKRANIDLELVIREGIARFINNNLDVLAPNEIEQFKHVLLVKPNISNYLEIQNNPLKERKAARKKGFQRIAEDAEMFDLAEQGMDDFLTLTDNYETT